jgi:hypothetical protein
LEIVALLAAAYGSQHLPDDLFADAVTRALRSACAWRSVNELPERTPWARKPLTRAIPAASAGARSPLSAASTANFRTAVSRTLIEIGSGLKDLGEAPYN